MSAGGRWLDSASNLQVPQEGNMVVRKMKEKCKDAARMRREKERAEFVELSKLLPLPSSTTSQLDKASIIRLTSSYLRMRSAFPKGLGGNWGKERPDYHNPQRANEAASQQPHSARVSIGSHQQPVRELGSLILQTLDGFAFALHRDGKIMYISETASVHLGLPQIDLTGSSVFEYIHPSDRNDILQLLSLNDTDKAQLEACPSAATGVCELGRSFCMRMKCILPKRNAGLVTNGYKAIHCSGYLKCRLSSDSSANNEQSTNSPCQQLSGNPNWDSYALVAVGHSLLPTASTEVKLNGNSFMFRANLDLKLHYIEASVMKLLGFEQVEMIGQSLYQFVHAADLVNLDTSHRSLLDKGQVVSKYYRLMRKGGGFVWVQSYASLVNNPRNMPKPQHVVSICFVLGDNQIDKSCILRQPDDLAKVKIIKSAHLNKAESSQSVEGKHKRDLRPEELKPPRRDKQLSAFKRIRKSREFDMKSTIEQEDDGGVDKLGRQHQLDATEMSSTMDQNNINSASFFLPDQQHQQCACLRTTHNTLNKSIGFTRRPSDDTCSIVSSVASTCVSSASSSSSSSHNNSDQFLSLYQPGGDGYAAGTVPIQAAEHLASSASRSYRQLSTPLQASSTLPMSEPHLALYVDRTQILTDQHLQQEPMRQLVPCSGAGLQPMVPMRAEFRSDGNVWISSFSDQSHSDIVESDEVVQTSVLEEYPSISFSQSNHQQHYCHSAPEWLPPTSSTGHCSNVLFEHQRQQSHHSYKGYECTEDGLAGGCLYSDDQLSPHYHQELPSHLNSTGQIHYQRTVSINNGYSMSSI